MKKTILIITVLAFGVVSCKLFVRTAAKHWTSNQIEEFIGNCEANASKVMNKEKATAYCDCAVDKVAKEYKNYDDVKKASLKEVLEVAKECRE